jgi:transposase InsO family protein
LRSRPSRNTWCRGLDDHRHGAGRPSCATTQQALLRSTSSWCRPRFSNCSGLVILGHERRRLIGFGVTAHPTAEWIARQVTEAFPWDEAPRYLIRDRDGAFGPAYTQRIRAMGIRDRPTAARSPWQNGHAERLIGSTRRECIDHTVVFNEAHLYRILDSYAAYYNRVRTHLALRKNAPVARTVQRIGRITAVPPLGGLHHQYVRI